MNGRIYDPKLGRFLQPDPVIQFPNYSQGWNTYSYVLNNPLTHTDPTGYFIGKLFKKVFKGLNKLFGDVAPFVSIALLAIPVVNAWVIQSWGHAFAFGFATGGIATGSLKGALFGGISAAAFYGIGEHFTAVTGLADGGLGHVLTHGLAGGILAELQGGQFGHGFLAAGLSKAVLGRLSYRDGSAPAVMGRTAIAAIVGGTVSRITGGKFANGALTSAMAQLFNAETSAARARAASKAVSITEDGNNVSISLRMKFVGDGVTDSVVDKFKAGIEEYWSGIFGSKNVTTEVLLVDDGQYFEISVPRGDGRAYMNRVGGLTGSWPANRPAWTAAHEMGHGMGLPDRYSYTTGKPFPGFENNIMGARNKLPNQQDILDIIGINR